MITFQNTVATPLAIKALKLHYFVYNSFYQCPLKVKIENCRVFVNLDNVLQLKYIPFLFNFVFVTSIIFPASCWFLLALKVFFRNSIEIGIVQLVIIIFAGSCTLSQLRVIMLYAKSSEIVNVINQIFVMEQRCKFKFLQNLFNKK